MHTNTYFTHDVGSAGNWKFLPGPLVLTYLEPTATVEIRAGHPAADPADSPLVVFLSGETFRGSFFVHPGWSVSGTTPTALVSGHLTNPALARLADTKQPLPSGGNLVYHHFKPSEISFRIPRDEKSNRLKMSTIREAEALLGYPILPIGDWEPCEPNHLVLYFEIDINALGIEHRIQEMRAASKP